MNLPRSSGIILMMGLIMALSPMGAEARPNQPFSRQPNFRAFTPRQPRMNTFGYHGQARNWGQSRARAAGWNGPRFQGQQFHRDGFGWNGQNHQWRQNRANSWGWHQPRGWQQPRGRAIGWNGSRPQWQHHPGNAYGWNSQHRTWREPRAYGWQGQTHNWQQHRGQAVGYHGSQPQWQQHQQNTFGRNGQQSQWQQHRQSSDQGYQGYRQFQNQQGSRPSYTPIGYSGSHQTSPVSPGSFTYPTSHSGQWGRSYPQSGFHGPQSSGISNQVSAEPNQVSN
jgi:hypothetical protein